jgi:DNA helicase II / ATP-dependent DNA helicase PcrA
MSLNEKQQEVVDSINGQFVVTAGPGSGKTRCIVERVANLIDKGVNPSHILCLTFTNKAANEMRERICKRLNIDDATFYIGTFHSLCVKILRRVGTKIGYTPGFSIFDSNDQTSLLKSLARQMGFDIKKLNFYGIAHKMNFGREVLEDENTIMQRFEDSVESSIAKKYLAEIKEQNAIDFSGLLYETVRLLKTEEDILGRLQNQFEYVMVDEIQDTNYAQFELVNLFAGKHKNVMIIGDINQSLYKFRGARYQNVLDFVTKYKECKEISLGKNYRSTPEIIKIAEKLIKKNSSFTGIKFETDNESGQEPQYSIHYEPRAEADAVAKKIKFLVNDEGWDYNDIAVFYRLNRMSLELQTAFAKSYIPFTVIGGPNFFDRKEIRDCLGMLRWLANSYDKIAFHRVIDMFSDIGDVTYSRIVEVSQDNNISLMEACSKIDSLTNRKSIIKAAKRIQGVFDFDFSSMHAGKALSLLISKINYYGHLEKASKNNKDYEDRKSNVEELINNATTFGQTNSSISDYLHSIALISSSDKESEDSVSLMTMHASKGLEFPVVFMIGAEEGIHPHFMALKDAKTPEEKIEAVEEERRIFFVGITRSERRLYVSSCENRLKSPWGKPELIKVEPSRFVSESGLK